MIDCFFRDAFWVLSCPFWSTVLQCGARRPIHTLTTGPWSQCCPVPNLGCVCVWHCSSSIRGNTVYKIRRNPMHPLNGALLASAGYKRCSGGTSVYLYATSQFRRTFILPSVSPWNDLANPVLDGVGLAGFKSRTNSFLLFGKAAVSQL